jgi:filamentous hemagglutinin
MKIAGTTGGVQGGTATFAGYTYPVGGVVDRVFKAFGGTHDFIGGQVPGLYDDDGNTRQGMTETERTTHNTWSAVAVIPSAPFAMAQLLPPEMWKAISVMLGAAK